MQVQVRNIAAHCPKCGAQDFDAAGGQRSVLDSQTAMRCSACGATATYAELIMQIADTAVARSAATIDEIRKQREAQNTK